MKWTFLVFWVETPLNITISAGWLDEEPAMFNDHKGRIQLYWWRLRMGESNSTSCQQLFVSWYCTRFLILQENLIPQSRCLISDRENVKSARVASRDFTRTYINSSPFIGNIQYFSIYNLKLYKKIVETAYRNCLDNIKNLLML